METKIIRHEVISLRSVNFPASFLNLLPKEYTPIYQYTMKTKIISILLLASFAVSCAPKSQFQTREGKAKNKHYNSIQYDKKDWKK